ncbi:hypothetical protein [Prosthecobacter sp.]|uniref:hypothetical protein n=1 Tax=Prosthecobacter sp. TaxID=1965333 RepID=UPI002ABB1C17|nr:hypothetical protein [Prosthecobacter sp.]MDZ4402325.1 hypothetical protein [Prosthecobacter sp.]
MSLEALKELSALDGEAKGLLHRYDELLLAMRRRFLNQIVECFTSLTETEGFRIKRDPMGASARLDQTELAISCTDPSHTLVDSQAKYSVTCSLAPNKAYGILLCRQPLVEFTNQSADTNDQITNKRLEIHYLKSLIETHGNDQWFVMGRLENIADVRSMTGQLPPPYESFQTFEQAVKTALRDISNAALAPRA